MGPVEETPNSMAALEILYGLKNVKRRGWLLRGVPPELCESDAGHLLSVTRAAFLYTRDGDLADMLMSHDWPEVICGDPTPSDNINPIIKHEAELAAMKEITNHLSPKQRGRYMGLWLEYEGKETPRSRLAHQLDKLDAAVKALYYENLGYDVSEFYPYTRQRLEDPNLINIFDRLMKRDFPLDKAHLVYFKLLYRF